MAVSQMTFPARNVFGSFEKRAPEPKSKEKVTVREEETRRTGARIRLQPHMIFETPVRQRKGKRYHSLPPPQALRFQSQSRSRRARSTRNWERACEGSREGERREAPFPLPLVLCARSCSSKKRETSGNEAVSFLIGY